MLRYGYTNFVVNNSVNERVSKKMIREIDDLPTFMKIYFGSFNIVYPVLMEFLTRHKCSNPGCVKFSYLKCQECRYSHYCGKECQVEDWDHHKEECQGLKDYLKEAFTIPNEVKRKIISIRGDGFLPVEIFDKEITYKVFETFYDSLKTPEFSFMFEEGSPFASLDISQLIRKRGIKSQSWKVLKKQFSKAFEGELKSQPLKDFLTECKLLKSC